MVVRSDGEPALLGHVRAARAMTMVSDVPLESVHEQVSKEQSPGNGLAEGAVKDIKAKIRTPRHSTEMGLAWRLINSLAWLVTHAAATINWFRPGLDGKTPYELRAGRKFRRPVAPWGQKVWSMSAKKHVSRISAESRWQEGIFLGILGGGVGASDHAIGTPDGVQPARAIKMVLEIDAWDIELLLAVKELPWDRRRADTAARIRLPAQKCRQSTSCRHLWENLRGPDRDESTLDVIGCPGCMAITAGTTAQGHSDECRARIEQKMLEGVTGAGAMRLEEAIRRKRARPDDESGRADVAMEVAARNPFVLFNMVVPVRRGETRAFAAQGC